MHNRGYYRNANGNLDPYARRRAGEKRDAEKKEYRDLKKVIDGEYTHDNYTLDVVRTISTNVNGLNTNREKTRLALRQPLAIVPRDEIAHALRVQNYTIVPKSNTLPTPVKQNTIKLVS